MEELNLAEILKGHEGEKFYSTLYGDVFFERIRKDGIINFVCNTGDIIPCCVLSNGKITSSGEVVIFPSKNQRDWDKWNEESNARLPKTWSDLIKQNSGRSYILGNGFGEVYFTSKGSTRIEKSALALLKIHQLIEVCYGGHPNKLYESWTVDSHAFVPEINNYGVRHILFSTKEYAKEFLSYPENIQLLKEYFMID